MVFMSMLQELLHGVDRPRANLIRVIEGFETVMFRSKFDSWPQTTEVTVSEEGRGKVAGWLCDTLHFRVSWAFFLSNSLYFHLICYNYSLTVHAALLKRQGFNVKGLLKADPPKEGPQPYIDCTGNLQVQVCQFYVE